MARYSVTPWRHPNDLLEVRQQLYRLNVDQQDRRRDAVNRIFAWKMRGGSLPHAVESTALLINAILHHSETTADRSLHSVRAVYTAAFTRFVTGFCDIGRARERSLDPRSMLEISREIGMPAEFVALRHEATHEELPGIQRLVTATEQSLDWLWNVYWSKLDDNSTKGLIESRPLNVDERKALQQSARSQFKTFRRLRKESLKRKTGRAAKESMSDLDAASRNCMQLFANGPDAAEVVVDVLIDDRLLLPTSRTLGSSMDGAFLIWNSFLVEVCDKSPAVLDRIVDRLLHSLLSDGTPLENVPLDEQGAGEATILWLEHFVVPKSTIANKEIDFYATASGAINRARVRMIRFCCLNPNQHTRRLGENLIATGSSAFKDDWIDLFQASRLDNSAELSHVPDAKGEHEAYDKSTWTRSILRPSGPIGVI